MKTARKILTITLVTFLLLLAGATASLYFFKKQIINIVFSELNKSLIVPVEIDRDVDINIFEKFPQISIRLKDVKIQDPVIKNEKLADLKKIYLMVNPLEIFLKRAFIINQISLEDGHINIKIDKKGKANYHIFKTEDTTSSEASTFNLKKISLLNVYVDYSDERRKDEYSVHSISSLAKIAYQDHKLSVSLDGETEVQLIKISGTEYWKDKLVQLNSTLDYDENTEIFSIHPSYIFINKSKFEISGTVENKNKTLVDLEIAGEQGKIQTLLSIIPNTYKASFEKVQTSGDVYFTGKISGELSETEYPLIVLDYGFQNASFSHPELRTPISEASLKGHFTNGERRNASTSIIKLQNIQGVYNNKIFKGNFFISNFNNPFLDLNINGAIDLDLLLTFYPIEKIKKAEGAIILDVDFKGNLEDFKTRKGNERIKTSGQIFLKDVNLTHEDFFYTFKDVRASLQFTKSDIAVKLFEGYAGSSHLSFNGYFKNIIPHLIFNNEKLTLEANLNSNYLNLEELLNYNTADSKSNTKMVSSTSEEYALFDLYNLNLNCTIKHLVFRRFDARNIEAKITTREPYVNVSNASLQVAGGKLNFKSDFKLVNKNQIEVSTEANTHKMYVDSIFYVFDNFDQKFLVDNNLKGQLNSKVSLFFVMNDNLDIMLPTLLADIDATVVNGKLVNFEPMKNLSKFVDEDALENISFSELKNQIKIYNNMIVIPEMDINTSITKINISGTHTFDSNMDYRLALPVKNFKKKYKDKDEAFGAIEDDGRGNPLLFLIIKGTTDNYKISYDSKRTGKKIKMDLKNESKELQNLIKGKQPYVDPKFRELNTDEYFDFD
jgi:hypothetical protein